MTQLLVRAFSLFFSFCPSLVLNEIVGIPAFSQELDDFLGNSWESVGNGILYQRKEFVAGCMSGNEQLEQLRNTR